MTLAAPSIWRSIPVLLSFLVGLLVGLIGRAAQRIIRRPSGVAVEPTGDVLVWMLGLGAFAAGVCVAYVFLRP